MHSALLQALDSVAVGERQHHRHLSLFPLEAREERSPAYVMLREALERGLARITEVGLEGSVPELLLDNASDVTVLLLDGDELVGARQNRILNVTLVAGPHTRTRIPVSCVERGRWGYASTEFRSEDRMMFARGRAAKMAQVTESLRRTGVRLSDQGKVWQAVAEKMAAFSASSRTEAMADVYAHAGRELDAYRGAFEPTPRQVGAVFAVDGHAAGVELFDAPRTFAMSLRKIVASYALDALEQGPRPGPIPTSRIAHEMLRRVTSLRCHEAPSVGEGTELRLEGPGLAGSAIVWGGRVVHLSVLEHELESGEEPRHKRAA